MFDYTLILVGALLGILAIKGDTWDNSKQRIADKLTGLGKTTLFLILCTAFLSAGKQYHENSQKAAREEAVKSIVNYEIDESIDSLLAPFRSLYQETNNTGYIPEDNIALSMLLSPKNLEKFQSVFLNARPQTFSSIPDAGTWNNIFESGIKSGVNRLKRLTDVYANQMEPELLVAVHKFLEVGLFNSYAFGFDRVAAEDSNNISRCFATPAASTYKNYLEAINVVYNANEAAR